MDLKISGYSFKKHTKYLTHDIILKKSKKLECDFYEA